MTRNNRFSIFTAAVMLAALTAWPSDVLAQRGGRSSGSRSSGGQAASRPAGSRPSGGQAASRPAGSRPAGGQPATGHAVPRQVYSGPYNGSGYRGYYAPYYRGYYAPYYRGYYSPYYWGAGWGWGFGLSFGWGYPYYGYGYPYYSGYYPGYYQYPYYPYYPYPYYQNWSDLRIQVTPRDAEVYLDGYLVGTVDDYDGTFQRLHVPYGEHQISVFFEGYRTIEQKMLFRPGEAYQIRQVMQPVQAGEAPDPRPTPIAPPPDEQGRPPMRGGYEPPMRGGYEPPMGERQPPPMRAEEPPPERASRGEFGALVIRVQPADAEILVDGERWSAPSGEDRLTVELAEGTHRLEIRKEGRKPYSADVQIRRGRTSSLNVSLPPGN